MARSCRSSPFHVGVPLSSSCLLQIAGLNLEEKKVKNCLDDERQGVACFNL